MSADGDAAAEPSYRFAVAPRFSISRPFEARLERNGGIRFDGERVEPQSDWRPLGATEIASLVSDVSSRDAVLWATQLGLVQVPEHLRTAWWVEAERSGGPPGTDGRFEGIFSKVVEFFRFKRLPLPERVSLRVSVSVPGLSSTRVGPAGALQGLGFGDGEQTTAAKGGQPVACINLGDETGFVVVLELPPATLARRLEAAREMAPHTPAALVRRYFEVFPGQSLLRVRLDPGEGLWFSPLGVIHDGWTEGKRDLDVMLHIGAETPTLAPAESLSRPMANVHDLP
jgi:hypothetical protein